AFHGLPQATAETDCENQIASPEAAGNMRGPAGCGGAQNTESEQAQMVFKIRDQRLRQVTADQEDALRSIHLARQALQPPKVQAVPQRLQISRFLLEGFAHVRGNAGVAG